MGKMPQDQKHHFRQSGFLRQFLLLICISNVIADLPLSNFNFKMYFVAILQHILETRTAPHPLLFFYGKVITFLC